MAVCVQPGEHGGASAITLLSLLEILSLLVDVRASWLLLDTFSPWLLKTPSSLSLLVPAFSTWFIEKAFSSDWSHEVYGVGQLAILRMEN